LNSEGTKTRAVMVTLRCGMDWVGLHLDTRQALNGEYSLRLEGDTEEQDAWEKTSLCL
jgi:hypothetical protein